MTQILPATGGEWLRKGSPAGKTPWATEVGRDGLKLECGHTHTHGLFFFFSKEICSCYYGQKREKPHRKKSQEVSYEKT